MPFVSTGLGLAMGIAFSLLVGNPWPEKTSRFSRQLLKISVVGLGTDVLKKVGFRPMIQGVLLWILVGVLSLITVMQGFIF